MSNNSAPRNEKAVASYKLAELYFSMFVLFYRISIWRGRVRAGTASIGVSTVLGLFVVGLLSWAQIYFHRKLTVDRWVFGVGFAMLFILNHYLLVVRGFGISFEKSFGSFTQRKQVLLLVSAASFSVVFCAAFFILVSMYRATFAVQ